MTTATGLDIWLLLYAGMLCFAAFAGFRAGLMR